MCTSTCAGDRAGSCFSGGRHFSSGRISSLALAVVAENTSTDVSIEHQVTRLAGGAGASIGAARLAPTLADNRAVSTGSNSVLVNRSTTDLAKRASHDSFSIESVASLALVTGGVGGSGSA